MLRTILICSCLSAAAAFHANASPRHAVRTSTPAMNFFSELSKGITKLQAGDYDSSSLARVLEYHTEWNACGHVQPTQDWT